MCVDCTLFYHLRLMNYVLALKCPTPPTTVFIECMISLSVFWLSSAPPRFQGRDSQQRPTGWRSFQLCLTGSGRLHIPAANQARSAHQKNYQVIAWLSPPLNDCLSKKYIFCPKSSTLTNQDSKSCLIKMYGFLNVFNFVYLGWPLRWAVIYEGNMDHTEYTLYFVPLSQTMVTRSPKL